MGKRLDIPVGTTFERLTVVSTGETYQSHAMAYCQCVCGTKISIRISNLLNGNTKSCGCYGKEWQKQLKPKITHNLTNHQHFSRWRSIMRRCYDTKHRSYKNYGARGITMWKPWHDPQKFCKYIDVVLGPCPPGMSFDRIDNNKGYTPTNVRWATISEQNYNRRKKELNTHCGRGHKWTIANTHWTKNPRRRVCRDCSAERARIRRNKQ